MMSIHIPKFEIEKELLEQGYPVLIGVDEVGRGPLCGPVVAAAALCKHDLLSVDLADKLWELVRDSKTLSEKQREKVFDFIHDHFYVAVGLCNHETIDRINILEASFLAMKKSVQTLLKQGNFKFTNLNFQSNLNDQISNFQKDKCMILVDGNKKIPNFSYEQRAVIGGDRTVSSIAAASIIAKVTRDRFMQEMHEKYPHYGFDKHKGYGTKLHLDALATHGPCEIHRKSFAPVKKCL